MFGYVLAFFGYLKNAKIVHDGMCYADLNDNQPSLFRNPYFGNLQNTNMPRFTSIHIYVCTLQGGPGQVPVRLGTNKGPKTEHLVHATQLNHLILTRDDIRH